MNIEYSDDLFSKEELQNTPQRVKKFQKEWLASSAFNFKLFKNPGYDQIIALTNIHFASLCAHHLLPFTGKAHIAYIPDKTICGLSKLARAVDGFAHRPQLQERLTQEIADFLNDRLQCRGVMVILEAEHTCMTIRGVNKQGAITKTSALKGILRTDEKARSEALQIIYGGKR